MSEILEDLAMEAKKLLETFGCLKKDDIKQNQNCLLFSNMPFTNVEIMCDFACHKNPLFSIKANTVGVVSISCA